MKTTLRKKISILVFCLMLLISLSVYASAASKSVTIQDGIELTDSTGKGALTNGSYSSSNSNLFYLSVITFTIKNMSGQKAQIKFDYSGAQTVTVDDTGVSNSGNVTKTLEANGTVTIKATGESGFGSEANLTVSNFSITPISDSSSVTVQFDGSYGSVTAGGSVVSNGTVVADVANDSGLVLNATAKSGATFLAWIDPSDHSVLSTAASFTLKPASDMAVQAVFVDADSEAWFGLSSKTKQTFSVGLLIFSSKDYYVASGVTHLYCGLQAATEAATTLGKKMIVLMNSSTLPAGNYTIPSGVTLLIPFDSANTCYTSDGPQPVGTSDGWSKPTAYRALTLASGANITVNGEISVSSQVVAGLTLPCRATAPHNSCGMINMDSGSAITVDSGGNLYAWGFITGDGTVTAESGATVYECFQFSDFRGGEATTSMKNKVFPFSQYYVQNIESTLYVKKGASVKTAMSVYMSKSYFLETVNFIGSSGCFINITGDEAYITKRYDGSKDRLELAAYGDVEISNIKMTISASTINSADFVLPLNSNITVRVSSGTATIKQDLALLPGSQLIIDEGATCTLQSGQKVYVYGDSEWDTYCYNGSDDVKFVPLTYAPGRTYTRTEADLVDTKIVVNGTLDASSGALYTTESGANICSDGTGIVKVKSTSDTTTYQYKQRSKKYDSISCHPAWLKNADGSYVTDTETATYYYGHGVWHKGEYEFVYHSKNDEGYDENCYACTGCTKKIEYRTMVQIRLIEPWGLKENIQFSVDGQPYTASDLEKCHVYYVRKSWLDDASSVTAETILNCNKKFEGTLSYDAENQLFTSVYEKGLYTYEFSDEFYILYTLEIEGKTVYLPILTRNLSEIINKKAESTTDASEKAVYQWMAQLEKDVLNYRAGFTNPGVGEIITPKKLQSHPVSGTIQSLAFSQSAAIRLIEPWGIRLSAKTAGFNANDYSEYGIIVLAGSNTAVTTPEQMLACKDAYVFNSEDGNVTLAADGSYFSAAYALDIYTYQLNSDIYVMPYAIKDGTVYCGAVKCRNLYDLTKTRSASTSESYSEKEKAVYVDMYNLHECITAYRAEKLIIGGDELEGV